MAANKISEVENQQEIRRRNTIVEQGKGGKADSIYSFSRYLCAYFRPGTVLIWMCKYKEDTVPSLKMLVETSGMLK